MTFTYTPYKQQRSEASGPRREIDFDALNEHMVTQFGPKERRMVGIISGIYDLGIQERDPYESEWNEKDATRPGATEYIEDGKRMLRIPARPTPGIAITVDFPQIIVDKGQFYEGKSDPKPLRLLLNGEFSRESTTQPGKKELCVNRPLWVQESKDDVTGKWAIAKTNKLHKLASYCDVLDSEGRFHARDIGKLLGKAAQFKVHVFIRDGKWLNERIEVEGGVMEGVPIPEIDPSLLHGMAMFGRIDPEAVRTARRSILNSCKRALNYDESDLKKLLESGEFTKPAPVAEQQKVAPAPKSEAAAQSEEWPEDDIPF